MTYKSAFIGCGPRARRHAEAYPHVKSIQIAAVADINPERLVDFANKFNIPGRYADYKQMLDTVKPDLVHCVTQPNFRVEPVRVCAEKGVKAIIIEKPMAENLRAAEEIEKIVADTGIKVIVNTQRRYFKSWTDLCKLVQSGQAGAIRHIHLYTNPAVSCVGSHVLDMVQLLLGDPDPTSVLGTAYGAEDWHTSHPGPASILASIIYPGEGDRRISLHMEMSKDGVGVRNCPSFWGSMGFDILCDKGHVWWTESNGWGYQLHGMAQPTIFKTLFSEDDPRGQGAFIEAIATWLRDPNTPHGNRLETAIRVYRIVCTIMQSAARGGRIAYNQATLVDCFDELRQQLIAVEGDDPKRVNWSYCAEAVKPKP